MIEEKRLKDIATKKQAAKIEAEVSRQGASRRRFLGTTGTAPLVDLFDYKRRPGEAATLLFLSVVGVALGIALLLKLVPNIEWDHRTSRPRTRMGCGGGIVG
jgi:hypothetical protein